MRWTFRSLENVVLDFPFKGESLMEQNGTHYVEECRILIIFILIASN